MKRFWSGTLLLGLVLAAACGGSTTSTTSGTGSSSNPAAQAGSVSTATRVTGLDTTYGTNGIFKPAIATGSNRFMAVAFAPDGSFFAAGFVTQAGDQAMSVTKFSPKGTVDTAFGKAGTTTVNVASGGKAAEIARAVAVQSSGKVIIAGPIEHDTTATGDAAKDTDIAVVRLDAQGKLDGGFGREGIARIDLGTGMATSATTFVGDTSWGIGSLAGDKIVVFGAKLTTAGGGRVDSDYVLTGLTAAGVLDSGFGNAGTVVVDLKGSMDNPRNLMVQADGKIVASGYSTMDGVVQPVLIRTSASGVLDTAFGSGGVATAKVLGGAAEAYAVGMQGDAYIVAGYGRGADAKEKVDLIAARFKADGSWDKSFGNEGVYRLDVAKEDDRARNLVVLPDGRVLMVGSGKQTATNVEAMLALVTKDGKPVSEFGSSGYSLSDLGGPADAWFGVAIAPDTKSVIVVGYKGMDTGSGGTDEAAVARIIL